MIIYLTPGFTYYIIMVDRVVRPFIDSLNHIRIILNSESEYYVFVS